MSTNPLVSVIIAAYNQEKIVGRAIESALAQETNFPVEIVVGEDCSSDNTREVIAAYAARYPDRVFPVWNEKNLFIQRNMVSMTKASRGKYVAWLDGDDYWTNPRKLAKQIEFLEANPEYTAVCHNVRVVNMEGEVTNECYPCLAPGRRDLEDLIVEDFVATPSLVFRNVLADRAPDWYFTGGLTDWPLFIVLIQDGPFMLCDDIMADYTAHAGSTWASRGRVYQCQMEIDFYEKLRAFLPKRYERLIRSCEGLRYERQSRALLLSGDAAAARRAAWHAATAPHWRDNLKDKVRILLDANAPLLMQRLRSFKGRD